MSHFARRRALERRSTVRSRGLPPTQTGVLWCLCYRQVASLKHFQVLCSLILVGRTGLMEIRRGFSDLPVQVEIREYGNTSRACRIMRCRIVAVSFNKRGRTWNPAGKRRGTDAGGASRQRQRAAPDGLRSAWHQSAYIVFGGERCDHCHAGESAGHIQARRQQLRRPDTALPREHLAGR